MKKTTLSVFTVILLLITGIYFNNTALAQTKKKKKIFIANIQAKGVPSNFSEIVSNSIQRVILEQYSRTYNAISKEDIKQVMKAEEFKQAMGCDSTGCMQQIADSINTDEMIYGTISQNNNKIKIYLKTMRKDPTSLSWTVKSIVDVSFYKSQIRYYAIEAGKKAMNIRYRIRRKDPTDAGRTVDLGDIKIKRVKGLDISIMRFTSTDRFVNSVIPILKKRVDSGDREFRRKDYSDAIRKYNEVQQIIKDKIPPSRQEKLFDFMAKIDRRIDNSYYMIYVSKIERVDKEIKGKTDVELDDIQSTMKKYLSIRRQIKSVGSSRGNRVNSLAATLNKRIDSLNVAVAAYYMKEGNINYNARKFVKALNNYQKAFMAAVSIKNYYKRVREKRKIEKAMKVTNTTGQSYVSSRVSYLIDIAIQRNVEGKTYAAKDLMSKAKDIIKNNERFATESVYHEYNETAQVLKLDRLKTQAEIQRDKQQKIERERREAARKKRESDRFWRKVSREKRSWSGLYYSYDAGFTNIATFPENTFTFHTFRMGGFVRTIGFDMYAGIITGEPMTPPAYTGETPSTDLGRFSDSLGWSAGARIYLMFPLGKVLSIFAGVGIEYYYYEQKYIFDDEYSGDKDFSFDVINPYLEAGVFIKFGMIFFYAEIQFSIVPTLSKVDNDINEYYDWYTSETSTRDFSSLVNNEMNPAYFSFRIGIGLLIGF